MFLGGCISLTQSVLIGGSEDDLRCTLFPFASRVKSILATPLRLRGNTRHTKQSGGATGRESGGVSGCSGSDVRLPNDGPR